MCCAPVLTYLNTLRSDARTSPFSLRPEPNLDRSGLVPGLGHILGLADIVGIFDLRAFGQGGAAKVEGDTGAFIILDRVVAVLDRRAHVGGHRRIVLRSGG